MIAIDILALIGFGYAMIQQIIVMETKGGKHKYLMLAFAFKSFCFMGIVIENILTYPQSMTERIMLLIGATISMLTYTGSTFEFLNLKRLFQKQSIGINKMKGE